MQYTFSDSLYRPGVIFTHQSLTTTSLCQPPVLCQPPSLCQPPVFVNHQSSSPCQPPVFVNHQSLPTTKSLLIISLCQQPVFVNRQSLPTISSLLTTKSSLTASLYSLPVFVNHFYYFLYMSKTLCRNMLYTVCESSRIGSQALYYAISKATTVHQIQCYDRQSFHAVIISADFPSLPISCINPLSWTLRRPCVRSNKNGETFS